MQTASSNLRLRISTLAGCLLSFCLYASTASAVSIANRSELQLRVALLDSLGTKYDETGDTNSWFRGGLAPHFGLGFGHALNENTLLDVTVGLSRTSSKYIPAEGSGEQTISLSEFELGPSLRYVADGEVVRFFFGGGFTYARARSENASDVVTQNSIRVGPFIGVHAFLNDYVSIDPAIGVSWVKGSSQLDGFDETASWHGYRVHLTIALSAWLGSPATSNEPDSRNPMTTGIAPSAYAQRSARPEPEAPKYTHASQIRFPSFRLELLGNPVQRGDALQVRAVRFSSAGTDLKGCSLVLSGDNFDPHSMEAQHTATAASLGSEEVLEGTLPFDVYERWVEHRPRLTMCGKEVAFATTDLVELRVFQRGFKQRAERAGTYQAQAKPAPTSTEPAEEAPVSAPTTEPEPSVSEVVAEPAPAEPAPAAPTLPAP